MSARRFACIASVAWAVASSAVAAPDAAYGPRLQGFDYPYSVKHYRFTSQGQDLDMAYMDVPPSRPNGRTAVLLHGKNFCSATWQDTIGVLSKAGYRVIAPDQIGFCKSSKPDRYQYSFQQLAGNTHALLQSLGVGRAVVIGHSTGGMLGVRYALMYPAEVRQLVLVSPIGLEDWKAEGVPWQSVDAWYQRERKTTAGSVRAYEKATYYVGDWKPQYERWVRMYAGQFAGRGRDQAAWSSALLYDMIYTQPVIHEFPRLKVPVLLIVGDRDTTAIGKDIAPPEVRARLGDYPRLAKAAAAAIPGARLIEFSDLGHAAFIQDPARFHRALLDNLAD